MKRAFPGLEEEKERIWRIIVFFQAEYLHIKIGDRFYDIQRACAENPGL